MASKVVPLVWYCKTRGGWKRLPAALHKNGKQYPRRAMVCGTVVLPNSDDVLEESRASGKQNPEFRSVNRQPGSNPGRKGVRCELATIRSSGLQ